MIRLNTSLRFAGHLKAGEGRETMEFFDDPSELDDHIIPLIRHYIDYGEWDLVENEIDQHIDIIKTQLSKMHNNLVKSKSLKKHKKNIPPYYYLLSECKGVGDVLDSKRFQIFRGSGLFPVYLAGSEEFAQCLLACYRIKLTLSGAQPSNDDLNGIKEQVDRLHRYLKESMLIIISSEKWGIEKKVGKLEKKVEKNEKGLKKGRKQIKGMISLYACISDILRERGLDTKKSDIFKKLRTYTDYSPYQYKNYELKYDADADKLYQIDKETDKERKCGMNKVYDYIKKIKKNNK